MYQLLVTAAFYSKCGCIVLLRVVLISLKTRLTEAHCDPPAGIVARMQPQNLLAGGQAQKGVTPLLAQTAFPAETPHPETSFKFPFD